MRSLKALFAFVLLCAALFVGALLSLAALFNGQPVWLLAICPLTVVHTASRYGLPLPAHVH